MQKRRKLIDIYNDMLAPKDILITGYMFHLRGRVYKVSNHTKTIMVDVITKNHYSIDIDFVYEQGYEVTLLERVLYGG